MKKKISINKQKKTLNTDFNVSRNSNNNNCIISEEKMI